MNKQDKVYRALLIAIGCMLVAIALIINIALYASTSEQIKKVDKIVREEPRVVEYHYYERKIPKLGGVDK